VCDWNSDGRLDLITGERNGYYTFFRRTEAGTLTNAGRIQADGAEIVASSNSWPWVCDWNRDGRKDLLCGQEGLSRVCNVYVYLNQGTDSLPVFGDSVPVLHSGAPFIDLRTIPILIDLDLDGRRDLVLGEWYSSVRLYHNSGSDSNPSFTTFVNLVEPDPVNFVNGNPPRVSFADWDGDTDLDMITCDYYGSVFLRRNVTPQGAEEDREVSAFRCQPTATVVAGSSGEIYDALGRRVVRPRPGVYFLRPASDVGHQASGLTKFIVAR
jgi:hypothetical protein